MNDKAIEAAAKALSMCNDCTGDGFDDNGNECPRCFGSGSDIRAAIAAYEAAMWADISEVVPETWKDGRHLLIEFVHANAEFSEDPVGEGWIAVHEAHWIDHNKGGWTWHGLAGRARRARPIPLPAAPESE